MKGTLYAAFVVKMVPVKMFFIVVLTASVTFNSPLSKFSLYIFTCSRINFEDKCQKQ